MFPISFRYNDTVLLLYLKNSPIVPHSKFYVRDLLKILEIFFFVETRMQLSEFRNFSVILPKSNLYFEHLETIIKSKQSDSKFY